MQVTYYSQVFLCYEQGYPNFKTISIVESSSVFGGLKYQMVNPPFNPNSDVTSLEICT